MRLSPLVIVLAVGLIGCGTSENKDPSPVPVETPKVPQEKPEKFKGFGEIRTYKYVAKIVDDGGVTPFEVGKQLAGQFNYDLKGKTVIYELDGKERPAQTDHLKYRSDQNGLSFQLGDLKFTASGDTKMDVMILHGTQTVTL